MLIGPVLLPQDLLTTQTARKKAAICLLIYGKGLGCTYSDGIEILRHNLLGFPLPTSRRHLNRASHNFSMRDSQFSETAVRAVYAPEAGGRFKNNSASLYTFDLSHPLIRSFIRPLVDACQILLSYIHVYDLKQIYHTHSLTRVFQSKLRCLFSSHSPHSLLLCPRHLGTPVPAF